MSIAGNTYVTFMQITGSYNFGANTSVSVSHDDGASFYLTNGENPQSGTTNNHPLQILSTKFTSPQETTVVTNTFSVSGQQNYLLDYVAGNGSPSVLIMTAAVPEPSTWALMIAGFAGIGLMAYRRRIKATPQLA
ncbi:PEP-CTERM sorting domain-containing protein [Tardiphaga robiniae]|uniref:PEP-CTERM sorting domain-containing protein n=2 Tax=Tardiphaga robiniae TaxID=943830 RepID=A0A7G6U8F2_9BRAD|nr:PEP-CTERM sorting domain-containing protein [Tardiphaga robiniae]